MKPAVAPGGFTRVAAGFYLAGALRAFTPGHENSQRARRELNPQPSA